MQFPSIQYLVVMIPPLLLAFTVHECAHAWAAQRCGDNTAADEGRLTLNPLAHLDPIGTLFLIVSGMFGWAKPVPVNPANFRNPVRDMALVAIAGPASNLILAILAGLLVRLAVLTKFYAALPETIAVPIMAMIALGGIMNLGLAFFNMLPFPPLDGFKVLSYFLKAQTIQFFYQYQMVFFGLLLVLIYFRVIGRIIQPVIYSIFEFLAGPAFIYFIIPVLK